MDDFWVMKKTTAHIQKAINAPSETVVAIKKAEMDMVYEKNTKEEWVAKKAAMAATEAPAAAKIAFNAMWDCDADHDGFFTNDELLTYLKASMAASGHQVPEDDLKQWITDVGSKFGPYDQVSWADLI